MKSAVLCAALTAAMVHAVDIYPGTNIQSVVNANPAGTTYILHTGTFRLQSITPQQGDVYEGQPGTILSGAELLTSFTSSGGYYLVTGQSQQGTANTAVPCQTGYDACQYPEELFFDSVRLQRVAMLSEVATGKWYFNYGTQTIYFYDNPAGHVVETSVTPHAFSGGGSGVTIENLTIEKYATPSQDGAISSQDGWIVENDEIRLNHGYAVRLDNGTQVLGSYIHDNGQMGMGAGGTGNIVDSNEIARNNGAYFAYTGAEGEAGGSKFSETTGLVVSNNYVHDNGGPGIWLDYDNTGWVVEENRTANNQEAGILDEISYTGTAQYNVVVGEGPSGESFYYGAGILATSSSNATITGNTLINCNNGIGAIAVNQGSGPGGPLIVQNLTVANNTIVQSSGYAAGMVADSGDLNAYTSLGNVFAANTYKIGSSVIYEWYSGGSNYVDMTTSQWTAAGEDAGGVWLASTANVPSTAFAAGDAVALNSATGVMALPVSASSTLFNLPAGAVGTITPVAGPIYSGGAAWWQASWPSGVRGWVPEALLMMTDPQALSWTGAPSTVTAGQTFTVGIQATAPAGGWSAVVFSLGITGGTISSVVVPGGLGAGKYVTCLTTGYTECVVTGAQEAPPAGTVSNLSAQAVTTTQTIATVTISATGPVTLTMESASMGTAAGAEVAVTTPSPLVITAGGAGVVISGRETLKGKFAAQ